MTVTAERIALSRDDAKAVIESWTDAGLPAGYVYTGPDADRLNLVFVMVENTTALAIWAKALGQDIEVFGDNLGITRCCPNELAGWTLSVFCPAPVVPHKLRIPCGGESR